MSQFSDPAPNHTGNPLASLAMYDWPECAASMDSFWQAIRHHLQLAGIAAPEALDRQAPLMELWTSPRLVLGQTCGFPYVSGVDQHVELVGLIDYGLEEAPPGFYYSVLIVNTQHAAKRIGDIDLAMDDVILAINGRDSQSGFRALLPYLQAKPLAGYNFLETGSHRASIQAVADGRATLAAIDANSFRLAQLHEAATGAVKVICRTEARPGTPLVTAKANRAEVEKIRNALRSAIGDLTMDERKTLAIRGLIAVDDQTYDVLRQA